MLSHFPELTVIIPTLNEEEGIEPVLQELSHVLRNIPFEILVVDGNSLDNTRTIAKKFGARVILEKRQGYGRAYKTGFEAARAPILVTLDGDFTYPATAIPNLVYTLMKYDLDFISIDRFSDKSYVMPLHRVIGNHVLNALMRRLFAINLRDSQSGMWAFRKAVLQAILPFGDDMSFSQEIKILAHLFFRAREVPGKYRKRYGKTKLDAVRVGLTNVWALLRLHRQLKHINAKKYQIAELDIVQKID